MIKRGDKVVLRYPEKSTWNDTKYAIQKGYLTLGGKYRVAIVRTDDIKGPSVWLEYLAKGTSHYENWGMSLACVEEPKPLRNLPDWF